MNQQPSTDAASSFRSRTVRRGIGISISVFSSLLLLAFGVPIWLLRDGLGPDSVESSGVEAWHRFFADFWPVAALCLFLFAIAFLIARRQHSTPNASIHEPGNA
jgi:hypothetical protein